MSTRSRRQTRQRRTTPYYAWPDVHNESIARAKSNRRATKRWEAARRERARARIEAINAMSASASKAAAGIRTLSVAIIGFGERASALVKEAERQRQIAWADRMAALGFDMREEHEALDRGDLVE